MKKLTKLFLFSLRLVALAVLSLIPKNKKVWIFGAWFGEKFSDNPKYFYMYLKKNQPEIRAIWIYKNRIFLESIENNDMVEAYYMLSPKGIYFQLISGIAFFTHSVSSEFCPLFISYSTIRFQMWHGIPFKKIGYDDEFHTRWWKRTLVYKLLINERYDYILSTGDEVSRIFSSAFDIALDKCISLGYPRNDVFFGNKFKRKKNDFFEVIYMPTYRNTSHSEVSFLSGETGFDYEKLSALLENKKIHLTLRLHPANRPSKDLVQKIQRSSWISFSTQDDIYETIDKYDCLLTDYSSMMFDFAISKKPILFFPFDIKNYLLTNRSMYHDYFDLVDNENIFYSWENIFEKIISLKNEFELLDSTLSLHRDDALLAFHDLTDVNETEQRFSEAVYRFVNTKIFNSN